MAATDPFLLDETQHHRPDIIQWWVSQGGQSMDQNMIHRYLAESPFFDWTTKNGLLMSQSRNVMETYQLTLNRHAFEAELRRRAGTEYLVVGEPQPVADKELAAQGVTTGVYVIRKQDRQLVKQEDVVEAQRNRKRASVIFEPHPDGRDSWQLTILGTYYIAGEALYQAPNVFDMVGNRLTTAAASLNKLFDIADVLPRYAPAVGHTYLPPRTSTRPTTVAGSVVGTPTHSREGSVAPDEHSLRSGSVQIDPQTSTTTETSAKDTQLLLQSLGLVQNYGDEYTDENPLTGEPGNFRYTTSMAAVKKRRADEEAAAAKARAEKESVPVVKEVQNVFSDPAPKKTIKATKDERRAGKPDKKRKKSRVNVGGTATSPTTPSSATSTQPPDSAI